MANKGLTIDNLGLEASKQYAANQKIIQDNPAPMKDASFVGKSAETLAVNPNAAASEFDQKYSLKGPSTSWAVFSPPAGYEANTLFSYQWIPSLGAYEKVEADEDKLETMKAMSGSQPILNLLQCAGQLDKILTLIAARRVQYQRG